MNIKILLIIIGLVMFAMGGILGFVLGAGERKVMPPIDILVDVPEILTNQEKKVMVVLESKALDSICANLTGEVTEIIEDTIVIISHQELLEIRVEQGAHIVRGLELIELAEIQKGELVAIYAVITEQGELIARGVSVH